MTLCPIALAVGCQKCPAFRICPLTKILGDVPRTGAEVSASKVAAAPAPKAKGSASRRPKRRR
jgi:hypothetical protein